MSGQYQSDNLQSQSQVSCCLVLLSDAAGVFDIADYTTDSTKWGRDKCWYLPPSTKLVANLPVLIVFPLSSSSQSESKMLNSV